MTIRQEAMLTRTIAELMRGALTYKQRPQSSGKSINRLSIPEMNSKEDIIRDFTIKGTSYYESNYAIKSPRNYMRRLRRALIVQAIGKSATGATVLDAGCGPAILFPEILQQCSSYIALDLTPSNLKCILDENEDRRIECVVGDLDSFDWESQTPDVIICSGAIEYVSAPEMTLDRMIRALRPGGLLVCSFPNERSPYRLWSEWIYTPFSRTLHRLQGRPTIYYARRLFSPSRVYRQIAPVVRRAELQLFGHRLLFQPLDAVFPWIDYRIAKCFASRRRTGWNLLASEFLLIVTK